jgi:hypothetical protein
MDTPSAPDDTGLEASRALDHRSIKTLVDNQAALTDFYRSRAADGRKVDGLLNELVVTGADSLPSPDSELMREICACMGRLIPTLKSEYADLVQRVDLGGEEPAAVAETAGITYNNLMVRLHRARQALRKSLEKSCGACTKHGCLDCTCGHGGGHAHGNHTHS